jgi:hypothetical protein
LTRGHGINTASRSSSSDYEPNPLQGRFYCEQKRAWCHARGIVYVPIFLREKLSKEQFAARVRDERQALEHARRDQNETQALRQVPVPPGLDALAIKREALRRLQRDIRRNPNIRGVTRARRLAALKRQITLAWAESPSRATRDAIRRNIPPCGRTEARQVLSPVAVSTSPVARSFKLFCFSCTTGARPGL